VEAREGASAMTMFYIGIDPGMNGAIAMIDEDGRFSYVEDVYCPPRDLFELLCRPRPLSDTRVAVERQQAMPGQGVSSSFQTGKGFGEILGVLACTGLPHEIISPTKWKPAMGLDKDKQKSREMARRLWPEAPLGRQKDEGRCEALLLAEWLRRRERP
jgi:crossover junction endodeoxyribonuclease RuvC